MKYYKKNGLDTFFNNILSKVSKRNFTFMTIMCLIQHSSYQLIQLIFEVQMELNLSTIL